MLRISLLGELRLEVDGVQVGAPSRRRARLLLAMLALERRSHSRETLASRLWPDVLDESARTSLRTAIAQLRAALGADGERFLQATRERVELAGPARVWTDVDELERLLSEGQVQQALQLWGGELLTGLEDDWVHERRDELRHKLSEALGRAAGEAEAAGDLQTALVLTRRHALLDPLAEEPQRDLMRRLACAGDCAAALSAYDKLSLRLREQLQTVPSVATRELAAAVRAGTVPGGSASAKSGARRDDAALTAPAAEPAAGLPTGVVTFLLTDVEGSTRLWDADADAMEAALELHEGLIANLVERHGGRLLKEKGEGDSTLSVFQRASRAVACAAELQGALETAPWPSGLTLRLRIALHSGEAQERDGDYFGPVLNRAARLRTLAAGGVTVLSQSTAELVRDRLPQQLALVDLGRHELRGLSRPECVFALRTATGPSAQTGVAAEPISPDELQVPFPVPPALAAAARNMFVGRAGDLAALADSYARAAEGTRQLVLLCGEPGIGKTRLATECALRAHEDGAIVLYGRCEEEALLAQQPFAEALRHYVGACAPQELAGRLRLVSGELRRIVPELADRIPGLPEPLGGDPEGARSRLFEAVSALLCEAAQNSPVVLVLDDLHWADKATLLLLKYLARYPREARLMILGTYRETELDLHHPLSATLAELGRERLLERRALAPLDAAAVSQLVGYHAGDEASPQLRQLVYEGTEGNAFFVVEVLRHLAESGAIGDAGTDPDASTGRLTVPDGVKDVIGQRLARLGPETIRLLIMASILGRDFELDVLQRLSELSEDDLVDRLDAAVRARVIEEVAGSPGRFTFSHALIRETLYGGLTATRRTLLHRRAGAALEEAYGAALEPYLAELAYHFAQARSNVDLEKAIEYGARAGEHAISLVAYEQAAAHFRQTVELIDAVDIDERQRQRCDLVIAQGEAERQAGDPAYRQTLLNGARLAQALHDPERLARAALANNRGMFSSAHGVDNDRVSVLRAALDAYDSTDSPTRAALLSLLAFELVTDHDWRLREKLSDDALAIARRVRDPRTLALVLTQRCLVQWTPQTLPELLADLREAGALADRLEDPLLAGHTAYLSANAAMDVGDVEQCDRLLTRLSAVAEQLGQPLMRWYAGVARAKRCLISGPADEAERLTFAALELGRNADQADSMLWFIGQLYVARFLHGSLQHGDPHLPDLIETASSSQPTSREITPSRSLPLLIGGVMSASLTEVGRLDDARRHLELLMSGLDELPHDYSALAIPAFATVACARLGDTRTARRLHALLEPHSHRFINAGPSWLGAATHYLGLLAATLDRPDEADARFAAAERSYASLGATPWLARLHSDWDSRR